MGSIPAPYKEKFDTDFVPSVIRWISKSEEPWNNPDGKNPLQAIHDTVYKTVDGILDRRHPLVDPVSYFTLPFVAGLPDNFSAKIEAFCVEGRDKEEGRKAHQRPS